MAFGPLMKLSVDGLAIELAPLTKEAMGEFVEGMQKIPVTKYLGRQFAPTLEDEHDWYDKVRSEANKLVWGIWEIEGGERRLIGDTSLFDITRKHIHQATSGSMIFCQEYWGRGIASHIHKARTWYAFEHLGLHRVMSAVIHGNTGSRKALARSGYELVYVERNTAFVDGALRHQDNLECLNPLEIFWQQWWGVEMPTAESLQARDITKAAMEWARQNVKLS
jgi:RimJ/RimL family protein N-acetyltransferase